MGLRSWVKKKAKKAKKKVNKTTKDVKKGVKETKKVAKKGYHETKDFVEDRVEDTEEFFKEELMSVIDKLTKEAEDKLKKIASNVGDEVKKGVNKVGDEVKEGVKKTGKEMEETFTKKIPDLFEDFIQDLSKGIAKEGLKKVKTIVASSHKELEKLEKNKPALVDEINNLGGNIEIGPLTLSYANFYTRMESIIGVLDHYINEPPTLRRRDILAMVKALGPDSVDLGASVQMAALVVSSKELGFGGSLDSIGINLFTELGDIILKELGVPA